MYPFLLQKPNPHVNTLKMNLQDSEPLYLLFFFPKFPYCMNLLFLIFAVTWVFDVVQAMVKPSFPGL